MDPQWYIDNPEADSLEQGDIIINCPITIPPTPDVIQNFLADPSNPVNIQIQTINCITLSQSCDIEQKNLDYVLVCPLYTFPELIANSNEESLKKGFVKQEFAEIKKGNRHGYHLLDKCPELFDDEFIIADFRNIFGIHIDSIKKINSDAGLRKRLQSPYKEHLSQAMARFFMRVGLPQSLVLPTDDRATVAAKATSIRERQNGTKTQDAETSGS